MRERSGSPFSEHPRASGWRGGVLALGSEETDQTKGDARMTHQQTAGQQAQGTDGSTRVDNRAPAGGSGFGLGDSVYERLLRDRIIFVKGVVEDEMANQICAQLLLLAAEDPDKEIFLYINSPGGSVSAGMAIYDTMQFVKNDVATVAMGMAASMGQFLLCAGTRGKRYALPHTRIMMHQPSSRHRGHGLLHPEAGRAVAAHQAPDGRPHRTPHGADRGEDPRRLRHRDLVLRRGRDASTASSTTSSPAPVTSPATAAPPDLGPLADPDRRDFPED